MVCFRDLMSCSSDPESLYQKYDQLLAKLFSQDVLRQVPENGDPGLRRIIWPVGREMKTKSQIFRSPGVYIWGAGERPLYIGMTEGSFSNRFNRYVSGERSQCALATQYRDALVQDGVKGLPDHILEWYSKAYSGTSRLRGAARFAEEGPDDIWFALLAYDGDDVSDISAMERSLIEVAQEWNCSHGLRDLLNIEFNRKNRRG